MAVTGRSFVLPVQQTGDIGQKKETQPVEAPGALIATQPVEATCVSAVMQPTSKDATLQIAADRPEVQPPDPASQTCSTASGQSEVQPSDPTGYTLADKNWFTSLTSTTVPSDEPGSDGEYFSDHAAPSHVDEEGEVSDLEFADRE